VEPIEALRCAQTGGPAEYVVEGWGNGPFKERNKGIIDGFIPPLLIERPLLYASDAQSLL